MTYPVITYLRADCPCCGRRWAILPDPERGSDYYAAATLPETVLFTVAGPGAMCPKCLGPLTPHMAVVTAGGAWIAVHDGPKAVIN